MKPTIRAVAVDDEPLALRRIRKALERHPDVELIEEIADGDAAVARLCDLQPDLLFLDIHMPGRSGFDVLAAIEPDDRPVVVFVTAYDEHALEAFRVHATDYLVKPFDNERFDDTMAHVRARLKQDHGVRSTDLQELLADMGVRQAYAQRIRVSDDSRTQFLPVTTIQYLEADGNYVAVHTATEAHRIRVTLAELLSRLDPATFVRIHRATVLNLDYLKEIQPWFSGSLVAILKDGRQLRISRRYRDHIMRLTL